MANPVLDPFFARVAALAQAAGIKTLVIVGQDPQTKAFALVATAGGVDACKDFVATKFDLVDPNVDVSWPTPG